MEHYKEEKQRIRISVRNLVEFLMRSGDIDNRKIGGTDQAMAEGVRLHKKIQKRMGSNYHPEYTLKEVATFEEYEVSVEGRAEGVLKSREVDEVDMIDELKCTYRELEQIKRGDEVQ